MGQILGRMLAVFHHKQLEVVLVGLEVGFDYSVIRRDTFELLSWLPCK